MNKFTFIVALMQMGAGMECLFKQNWKMAAIWILYAATSLILATIKE